MKTLHIDLYGYNYKETTICLKFRINFWHWSSELVSFWLQSDEI